MVVGRKSAEVLDHEPEEVSTSQNLNIAKNNITKNSHSNYSKYMCILLYSTSLLKCERNHPLLHCETRASPSMDDNSSSPSNSTIEIIDAFTISLDLASLSTIACVIALVVLIYFKLYRSFIYRLVLYSFLSLIIVSLSTTAFTISFVKTLQENGNIISMLFYLFYAVSLTITSLLATIINLCICILALFNHQFTYRADIFLLIFSPTLVVVSSTILILIGFVLNVFLTVLTLVPLCSRACGYNMCVKTVRTRESYRKALKEILPLLILPLPAYFPLFTYLSLFFILSQKNLTILLKLFLLVSSPLGLVTVLSFALHLYFIGKANLHKQHSNKKTPQVDYGTANQCHTHHTTVFISGEGISETCNTEFPYVSEGEEDTRYLQQRNNQQ